LLPADVSVENEGVSFSLSLNNAQKWGGQDLSHNFLLTPADFTRKNGADKIAELKTATTTHCRLLTTGLNQENRRKTHGSSCVTTMSPNLTSVQSPKPKPELSDDDDW
jgi:hypothetical protein